MPYSHKPNPLWDGLIALFETPCPHQHVSMGADLDYGMDSACLEGHCGQTKALIAGHCPMSHQSIRGGRNKTSHREDEAEDKWPVEKRDAGTEWKNR